MISISAKTNPKKTTLTIYRDVVYKPVPYTIKPPYDRFNEVNEAKIVMTRFINKNIVLFELCGQLYPCSENFLIPGVNDFSTVISSVNDKNYIMFLGPMLFVIHDCQLNVI